MKSPSNITAMVIDLGMFVELARTVAQTYKKVYYCNPSWVCPYPKLNEAKIGEGFPEIEVCLDPFDHFEDIDLYVFPDIGYGGFQTYLESEGKKVWGCRMAEELEFYRDDCKKLMKRLGLPVGPWEKVKSIDSLREYLKEHKKQWVKMNQFRGHFETFFSDYYTLVEPRIDEIEHQLGALKNMAEFVVEEHLPDMFEVAADAYNIDGEMPTKMLYGVEIKDQGYIGKFTNYENIPKSMREFDTKMSPTLKRYGYRSFYSPEHRIGKEQIAYMIDLCARVPSPPGELYQVYYTNLAEIIWEGANGNCIDPAPIAKWAAEIVIHSPWATKNWQPIGFPNEYEEYIKFRNAVRIDGKTYVMPQMGEVPEIGGICGYGDTMEEAINMTNEISESIKGYFLEIPNDALNKAQEEIDKAKEFDLWPS